MVAGESLDEDLHTTAQTEHEVERGLLLNVVIGKSTAILKLLAGEDEALLVRRNAFLVLDLCLHVFNSVTGLDVQGDGLAGESLDEDLHTTAQTEHEVERGLLLNVVIGKSTAIL